MNDPDETVQVIRHVLRYLLNEKLKDMNKLLKSDDKNFDKLDLVKLVKMLKVVEEI